MGEGGAPLASDQLAPVCEGGEFLFVPRAQCSLHITCQSWTPSSKLPTASCPLHLIFLGCPHPRLPPRKLSLARIKGHTTGVDALKAPTSDVSQLAGREQGRNQNRQENAAVPCLKQGHPDPPPRWVYEGTCLGAGPPGCVAPPLCSGQPSEGNQCTCDSVAISVPSLSAPAGLGHKQGAQHSDASGLKAGNHPLPELNPCGKCLNLDNPIIKYSFLLESQASPSSVGAWKVPGLPPGSRLPLAK